MGCTVSLSSVTTAHQLCLDQVRDNNCLTQLVKQRHQVLDIISLHLTLGILRCLSTPLEQAKVNGALLKQERMLWDILRDQSSQHTEDNHKLQLEAPN